MEINLKFLYKNLTEADLEILLQDLQADAFGKDGMVYSITKIKNLEKTSEMVHEIKHSDYEEKNPITEQIKQSVALEPKGDSQ